MPDEYSKLPKKPQAHPKATLDSAREKDVAIPDRMKNVTPESLLEARIRASTKYQQERKKAGLPPNLM